jgi:hypothetical protein
MNIASLRFSKYLFILLAFVSHSAFTQSSQQDTSFKPSGKLWGQVFGDFYYKAEGDSLKRGSNNQYSSIEKNRNAFQLRRIYLGYNYNISPKFSSELLLAAEDNLSSGGTASGDLLSDNKLTFYIKLANLRWKNIWKGTDLIVGASSTPAFPLLVEPIWGYRSVEKTSSDIRRTPSYDLGVSLQAHFNSDSTAGYNVMVGNGTGARPENNRFKYFYGDVWMKLLNKRLVLDLYGDYQRLDWKSNWHHSTNMVKGFIAYTTPRFTGGIEAFTQMRKNDVAALAASAYDTTTAIATSVSIFLRGKLSYKVAAFVRYDYYDPNTRFNGNLSKALSANYDPNNKEQFLTLGVDYSPAMHIHFIPNIWYSAYTANQAVSTYPVHDHELVYRITFSYQYNR